MNKQFEVSANGQIFGTYAAATEQEAIDLCAIDAGYKSEADMADKLEQDSELTAVELSPVTGMFGRKDESGNVVVLMSADGAIVTRINANVYPVGSSLSAMYEHPAGIALTESDAAALGIEIE